MHLLDDDYLKPFEAAVRGRAQHAFDRANELTLGKCSLADWASAHDYYGLHRTRAGWVFREWAPHATSMWLVGDFNGWKIDPDFEVFRIQGTDTWERKIPLDRIRHGDKYHLEMRWDGGHGERIPAYARYVVQDEKTKLFSACVWAPARRPLPSGDALGGRTRRADPGVCAVCDAGRTDKALLRLCLVS